MRAENTTPASDDPSAEGSRLQPAEGAPDRAGEAPQEDVPVQYYSRSELPQREVALHRFSLRRKSTLIGLSLVTALVFIIAGAIVATTAFNRLDQQAENSPQRFASEFQGVIGSARIGTLGLAAGAVVALAITVVIIVRVGLRIISLEFWIRRMGAGDLTYSVAPSGNDEITEISYDLEVLRRQSVRAQRLDLVQELSENLQHKNEELEVVLEELRATQDQVISRQKLAELGELTAGVAHEIRNPLNLSQNFARASEELMRELQETLEELRGPPDREQAEVIDELVREISDNMGRICDHGDRANRIVQDMLAMGRLTRSNHQTMDINELVEDHAMLAYHSARGLDPMFSMEMVLDLDPNAGAVDVIPEDIARVILNLVSNACHATSDKSGSERGYQPTLWISTSRDGDGVTIRVKDNGNGIPEEIMDRIFNPFFTTKPAGRGTGLGLSMSNDIIREHGGDIRPESQPGEYAQFTVSIPSSHVKQAGPSGEPGPDPS